MDAAMIARVLEETICHIGDGGYTIFFKESPSISGFGDTLDEAICQLLVVMHLAVLSLVET